MNWTTPILEHSGILLAGGSAFLALGLLINLLQRTPILRIRVAEMAVGSALVLGVLTFAPLPRAFAPEPITLSNERQPLPAFDLAPILSLLDRQPVASADAAEAAPFPAVTARTETSPLGPTLLLSEQSTAPLIETPPLFAEDEVVDAAPFSIAKIVLGVWLTGAALAAIWLLLGAFRIRLVLRNSRPAPRHLLRLLRDQGVQLPRGVRLRVSDREVRPFCVGALRPTIVIPRSLLDESQAVSLAPVVQHELAHATQGDARGLWLFAIALLPLWFHPLYWWLRAQHRFATELVADAIAADKTSNRAYARELMHLVECQAEQPTLVVGATALFRKRSDFYQRMQMLLTRNNSLATRTSLRRRALHGFLCMGLLAGAASVGGAAPVSAQEPEADPAFVIQQLQAENTLLRADLQEMRVVLTELKDMLTRMQMQRDFDQRAEAQNRMQIGMNRMDEREREVDALMQALDPGSPEQVKALAALGYMLVDDTAGYLPYTVKAGDTVTKIAEMTGQLYIEGLMSLAQLNPDLFQVDAQGQVSETHPLQPGMTVLIPLQDASIPSSGNPDLRFGQLAGKTHTVKQGESVYSIAKKHGLGPLELQQIFVKLNPELVTLDAEGRVGSTRPLRVGDKLQIPYLNGIAPGSYILNQNDSPAGPPPRKVSTLRGSVTTNSPSGIFRGAIESGTDSGGAFGGRRAVDPASDDILSGAGTEIHADSSDLPLIGALFGSRGTDSTQPATPKHRSSLPSVNLAECMELSFRAIDLQGELELAKAGFEYSEQLAQQGLVGELELQKSRIALVTLERKYGLSRSVIEARMNDLKQQIDELSSRYTKESPNFPRREVQLRKQAIDVLASSL